MNDDDGRPPSSNSQIICLLDTSVVIDFLRDRANTVRIVSSWQDRGVVGVSALTVCEVYQGIRRGQEEATQIFLERLGVVELDRAVALDAGLILCELRRKGRPAPTIDGLIAATALTLDVPLLTNDSDHYLFPGLTVVSGR